MPKSKSR
ncbi:UNVERIFIED_CONTAM: hypothetical protein GTU68_066013 [Idotea baltica]|nr:hypothetical protein [Idotea baltica]